MLLKNPFETIKLGTKLGRLISRGNIIALRGELGSGKTTFVKGIAKGLSVKDARHVNSPSFVIIKEYIGRFPLYHFDVYRLNNPLDLETVGYKDYFYGDGISAIEWAGKIKELLPEEYLDIEFVTKNEDVREVIITPYGKPYEKILEKL